MAVDFSELLLPGEQIKWQANSGRVRYEAVRILPILGAALVILLAIMKLQDLTDIEQQRRVSTNSLNGSWADSLSGLLLQFSVGILLITHTLFARTKFPIEHYALSDKRAFCAAMSRLGRSYRFGSIDLARVKTDVNTNPYYVLFVPLRRDDGNSMDWTLHGLSASDYEAGLAHLNTIMGAAAK